MHDSQTLYQDPILTNLSVGPKTMPVKPGTKPLKPLSKGMGLYQVLYWPKEAAKAGYPSKPWAVVNLQTRDVNGRWHASKEEALSQARALYSKLGAKAKVQSEEAVHNAYFLFADPATLLSDDGVKWIEAIAAKTYVTPAYGEVPISTEKIDNFVHNLNTNTRGQDVAINFEHGIDPAKGLKAAGWVKQARKNDRGNLELAVDFTEPAKQEILNKEWKYFSLEWDDEWMHPDGGIIYNDVIVGGALTNRPVAKGLMPINFSEIFTEHTDEELAEMMNEGKAADDEIRADDDNATIIERTENMMGEKLFATWDTAYVNKLPDSAFAFVEAGTKDSEGKTTPRSKRHFPYKDASGKIDLAHVRNMIARAPQAKVPDAAKTRVQSLGRRLLGAKSASELIDIEYEFGEQKELEHSQPGTIAPRLLDVESANDIAIESGSRRNTPPYDVPPQVGPLYDQIENGEVTIRYSEAEAVGYVSAAIPGLRRIHTNDGDKLIERIERILATPSASRSFNELQLVANDVRAYLRSNKESIPETTTTNDDTVVKTTDNEPITTTGGYTVGELTERDLRELRAVLDVDDDAKIVEGVKVKFGELAALRDSVSASEQERIFAEQYPQFYEQHRKLVEDQRKSNARSFSESVERIRKAEGFGLKTTTQGLSTACKEKLEEVHLKFSEGVPTVEDFEEAVKAITNGGIVNFGELGSAKDEEIPDIDTSGAVGIANARKVFGEIVAKIQHENPEMDYRTAVAEAAKKSPDLAEAYKVTLPA